MKFTKKMGLLLGMMTAFACGSVAMANQETFEPKAYTIALGIPSSGMPRLENTAKSMEQLAALSNGSVMYASAMTAASDPDACISFVEQSLASGADGVVICPPSDSVLPRIISMCEESGAYLSIMLRSIQDDEIREMVEASDYYVGNTYEDEMLVGNLAGQMIIDAGYKKVGLISTAKGNTTGDQREQGLLEVLEENGATVVGEARAQTQASEVSDDVASLIAANSDMEVIFQVATFANGGADAAIRKIQEIGSDVKYVLVDSPTDVQTAFDSGVMPWFISPTGRANLFFDPLIASFKCVNAIQGMKLTDEGATSSSTLIKAIVLENADDAQIISVANNDAEFQYFTDESMSRYLAWNNPDLTAASFEEMVQNYDPMVESPYFQ